MQGSAATVWDGYSITHLSYRSRTGDEYSDAKKAESKNAFHNELVDYFHGLLGERPIISPGQHAGQYIIVLPPL